MTVVLDTHAWIWWVTDPKRHLRSPTRRAIERALGENAVVISVISCWEIALKHSIGKLRLPMPPKDWIDQALIDWPGTRVEPLSVDDALASTTLPGELHRDPADRFIVALTRRLGAKLATIDTALVEYPHVDTI